MTILPDRKRLLRDPMCCLAFGFGTGLISKAPGTLGTLVAMPLFGLMMLTPEPVHYAAIALMFFAGLPICARANEALGVDDDGSVVWDEIVAFLLVLEFAPLSWTWWLAAFLLFRLFDIWKPFPIRELDLRVKGGFGVMLDDLLAAFYAIVGIKVLQWLMMSC